MAFGTPTANVAAAAVAAATQNLSVAAITAGRIVFIIVVGRRNGTNAPAPGDPTISDTGGWTWNQVFPNGSVPGASGISNPGDCVQFFWAVSNGSANTVTVGSTSATTLNSQAVDFSIGAGNTIDSTNRGGNAVATGTNGTPTVTLGSAPAAGDLGIGVLYGGGGTALSVPTGFTSIGSIASSAYRAFYDSSSPAQTVSNSLAGAAGTVLGYVALKEASTGSNASASQAVTVGQTVAMSAPANVSSTQATTVVQDLQALTARTATASQATAIAQAFTALLTLAASASQPVVLGQAVAISVTAQASASQAVAIVQAATIQTVAAAAQASASQPVVVDQAAAIQAVPTASNVSTNQTIAVAQTLTADVLETLNVTASQAVAVGQSFTGNLTVTGIDLFSNGTGAAPDGCTARWTTSSMTYTENSPPPGYVRAAITGNTGNRRLLQLDEAPASADIEVYTKIRASRPPTVNTSVMGAATRASGAVGAENGYTAHLYTDPSLVNQFRLNRYSAGGVSTLGAINFAWVINTWYRIRLRCIGSSIKAKIWLDGDAEPGTWDIDVTNSDVTAGGWNGMWTFLGGASGGTENFDFDFFSYATNSGTAPEPLADLNASASQEITIGQSFNAQLTAASTASASQPVAVGQTLTGSAPANATASQGVSIGQAAQAYLVRQLSAAQPIDIIQSFEAGVPAIRTATASQAIVIVQDADASVPANIVAAQPVAIAQSANAVLTAIRSAAASQQILVGQAAAAVLTQRASASQPIILDQQAAISISALLSAAQPIIVNQYLAALSVGATLSVVQPIVIGQIFTGGPVPMDGPPIFLIGRLDGADGLIGLIDNDNLIGSIDAGALVGSL